MPSSGRAKEIDRVCSTSTTSSSTSRSTLSVVMSAARTWRCASARTCQLCQVERRSSTAASTFSAVAATHSAFTSGLVVEIGLSVLLIMAWTASRSAERFGGLGVPGGALLGQRAGFVLGVPGLQGGLLRQLHRLHRRRRPTMITLKLGRQYTLPVLDQHPPRRPTLVQRRVHTDDLTHRPLTQVSVRPIGEPHPQPVAEMVFQGGVVGLRRRHGGFEQHPSVDGQPASVEGLHLVRNRHMGV